MAGRSFASAAVFEPAHGGATEDYASVMSPRGAHASERRKGQQAQMDQRSGIPADVWYGAKDRSARGAMTALKVGRRQLPGDEKLFGYDSTEQSKHRPLAPLGRGACPYVRVR